jgi:2-oxoglutarate ferredoxin oxidoreductase subunit gamma
MSADRAAPSRQELRIAGTGGQGLILAANLLAKTLAGAGRRVAQSQTYEPTSRGGFCNSDLVVSEGEVDYPLATAVDALVLLDTLAVAPSWPLLKPGALVLADARLCPETPAHGGRTLTLPFSRTAIELGSERVTNIVALGALVAMTGVCDLDTLRRTVREETPRAYVDLNLDALDAGAKLVAEQGLGLAA